jgi:hypothetical protein
MLLAHTEGKNWIGESLTSPYLSVEGWCAVSVYVLYDCKPRV